MGNCASTNQEADGKARSDMIDRQIEEDSKKFKRECKILLLGVWTFLILENTKTSSINLLGIHPVLNVDDESQYNSTLHPSWPIQYDCIAVAHYPRSTNTSSYFIKAMPMSGWVCPSAE